MRLRICLVLSILGLLVNACSQPAPPPPPQPDFAAEERAVRDVDAQWLKAAQARDAAGEAAILADDGVIYPGHSNPLVGPAAWQAYLEKDLADNPKASISWTTDTIIFAKSGEMAVQTGKYEVTGLGPKGSGSDTGNFVTVWKKVNGVWKVAYDIGSSILPETPSK